MGLLSQRILELCSLVLLASILHGPVAVRSINKQETRPFAAGRQITRLDVEIKTRDEKNAKIGSVHILPYSDHVWLDLGFKAWDLSDEKTISGAKPFRKNGATDRWENLELPDGEAMSIDDIFELRLEKKGLGGLTHAGDGLGGGWKPESITLFVNGEPFGGTLTVLPPGERLGQHRPAWRHLFRSIGVEDRFLNGLRVEPMEIEKGSGWFTGLIAGLTTPFKNLKISGWQEGPLEQYQAHDQYTSDGEVKDDPPIERVSVEGILYNPPHSGTDGYITLDLRLETVTIFSADGTRTDYTVNSENGIPHRRYIRVEYVRRNLGNPIDNRYKIEKWAIGDRFYAEGRVRWDTDEMGFYEIHPALGEAFLRRLNTPSPQSSRSQ